MQAESHTSSTGPEWPEPNGHIQRSKPAPGLHIVGTPIGNLRDVTLRALDVLRGVDLIVCEDTRVTRKLLSAYAIKARLTVYHDHNADRVRPALIARLKAGESLALVTDAGMPLISDPGYKLVREAVASGVAVTVVPGPSATIAALSLSGLPPDRFLCAGFLPARPAARQTALDRLRLVDATLLFFESPRRLAECLGELLAAFGDRPAAVAREITKLYEEVRRGCLSELAAYYRDAGPPRGEIVIVVGPPLETVATPEADLDDRLRVALAAMSHRDAAALVAAATGLPRRQVYARALALAERDPAGRA